MDSARCGGKPHTRARASLVLLRSSLQTAPLRNPWLVLLSQAGTRVGGKKGDPNAAVGVIGMKPAPIGWMPRYSAAESPTNEARAETMMASQPSAAETTSRSQLSALLFVISLRARMASAGPISFAGRRTFLM